MLVTRAAGSDAAMQTETAIVHTVTAIRPCACMYPPGSELALHDCMPRRDIQEGRTSCQDVARTACPSDEEPWCRNPDRAAARNLQQRPDDYQATVRQRQKAAGGFVQGLILFG